MNYFKNSSGLLIRFDDISENMKWEFMEKCEVLFDEYNIKPVLGIIPNNQDNELKKYPKKENFWQIVKRWQSKGLTIAMHGYSHVYDNETYKTSEEIEIDKLNCFLKEKCREIENFAQESKLSPDHMYYNLLFYVKQSAIYNLSYP